MDVKFYTLMYVAPEEGRRISRRIYSQNEKTDLYVKGCCALDKSLKINGMGGVIVLTNNPEAISDSFVRIGYQDAVVEKISFDLDVPKGIRFYSAHFKIDVFRYLATRPTDQYSILLDNDIICLHRFSDEFCNLIEEGTPTVYSLRNYGGKKKMNDVKSIVKDVAWMQWAGGEYIGGTPDFFKTLYADIINFKDNYWNVVNSGLFHVGDEMMTSIALAHLRRKSIYPVDASQFGVVYRYWSNSEKDNIYNYNPCFLHLPGDKEFIYKTKLDSNSIKNLLRGYEKFRIKRRFISCIKFLLKIS